MSAATTERRDNVAWLMGQQAETVDSIAGDIEGMRLNGPEAVAHLRLLAALFRERSDEAAAGQAVGS